MAEHGRDPGVRRGGAARHEGGGTAGAIGPCTPPLALDEAGTNRGRPGGGLPPDA